MNQGILYSNRTIQRVVVTEVFGPSYNVLMAVIGGLAVAFAIFLFHITRKRTMNVMLQFWNAISFKPDLVSFSLTFISGMLIAGGIFFDTVGYNYYNGLCPYGPKEALLKHTSAYGFALAGLLVGLGGKMIHGGFYEVGYGEMTRHSLKALMSVLLVLLFGVLGGSLAASNTIPFFTDGTRNPNWYYDHTWSSNISIIVGGVFLILGFLMRRSNAPSFGQAFKQVLSVWLISLVYGSGLLVAGLTHRQNVIHGLSIFNVWSPVLLISLAVTLVTTFILFLIYAGATNTRESLLGIVDDSVKPQAILGSILFGLGWGLSGLDVATWILQFPVFTLSVGVFFGLFMMAGMLVWSFVEDRVK